MQFIHTCSCRLARVMLANAAKTIVSGSFNACISVSIDMTVHALQITFEDLVQLEHNMESKEGGNE